MWLRARSKTALCLSVASFLFTPAIAKHQATTAVRLPAPRVAMEPLTLDRRGDIQLSGPIAPAGYDDPLATEGRAARRQLGEARKPVTMTTDRGIRFAEPAARIKRTEAGKGAGG